VRSTIRTTPRTGRLSDQVHERADGEGWMAYRVTAELPQEVEPFEEVQEEVARAVNVQRGLDRAAEAVKGLLDRLRGLTGEGLEEVLPTALAVQEARPRRIPTGEFNRLLQRSLEKHPPPTRSAKQVKIYYGSQVCTDPPTFLFHTNNPQLIHFSYQRYLENQIRAEYGFIGTPIRLSFRGR
jgi:predicted GTPase